MCTLHLVQQLGCIVLVKVAPQKIIDLHKKNLGCSFNEITILTGKMFVFEVQLIIRMKS